MPASDKPLRCKECSSFRASLRVRSIRLQRRSHGRTDPSSSVPYCTLSNMEMQEKMKNLHQELRKVQKQQDRLKKRMIEMIDKHGILVDEQTSYDLKQIIIENEGDQNACKLKNQNSFQHLFSQQQKIAASKQNLKGMRWHPLMIKWCIFLRHQSQSAYETLRQSGCVLLPSQRTLRDYTHHIKPSAGFSADVDTQLYHAAKLDSCEEREKYVILLLDEMHIKEDLVFDKHSGELIGFINLGDINSHLLALEQSLTSDSSSPPLANSMMTFMVRGLFSHLQFPYAHFPCHNLTSDLLYAPFWEAVYRLERLGFKVHVHVGYIHTV